MHVKLSYTALPPPEGGGVIFAGYVPLASQNPDPIIVYSVTQILDPILVTFGQICNFHDPNLVTFYFCIYLILNEEQFTFHLQYKHSGTFGDRRCEELSYPQKSENVRPHYCQSTRENATPSSGTSPLASYKEVPPGTLSRFDICHCDTGNGFSASGWGSRRIEVFKRCLQALPASLFPPFFVCSLFHCSLDRFFRTSEVLAKASCKQTIL